MSDPRIHNVVKIYPDFIRVFGFKTPIPLDGGNIGNMDNNGSNNSSPSVDYIDKSIARTHTLLKDLILCNEFEWFLTLTISPDKADRHNTELVKTKVSQWFKNQRKKSPTFGYIIVPEHHDDGALHFHGVVTNPPFTLYDTGHKDKKGRPQYRTKSYTLGINDWSKIDNKEAVAFYIRKYISKSFAESQQHKKRFYASTNLNRPEKHQNANIDNIPSDLLEETDFFKYGQFGV